MLFRFHFYINILLSLIDIIGNIEFFPEEGEVISCVCIYIYMYTAIIIGPISYPDECDVMIHLQK